jgi:hypothetical protein
MGTLTAERQPIGVIEGFFGRGWSADARAGHARFSRSYGFDHYIYAPKADRFLRRGWRDDFPPDELERLAQLARTYRALGVRFGVGLTPFEIYLQYDENAKAALRAKINQLESIGLDILCVLFDDMRGEIPELAERQVRIVSDIACWSSVKTLIVAPTYYSDDLLLERVFGAAPPDYLESIGRLLDPAVNVFWTGEHVCSSAYPRAHLEQVATRLRRKPFIWDNHIANDGRSRCSHLYLDFWSQEWSIDPDLIAGIAVNPMNQPQLSRVSLAAFGQGGLRSNAGVDAAVLSICGAALGAEIIRDLDVFQYQGLSKIDDSMRARLIDKYRRFEPDPCALEIGAWLRGEYEFDPSCLTE